MVNESAFGSGAVFRVDPITDTPSLVSSGGNFVIPFGIAIEPSGDILVSDRDAFGGGGAIIRVDPVTGVQTVVSSGGNFLDPADMVVPPTRLTSLSPAKLWVGLRNSDDTGTALDVRVEVLKNSAVVAAGLTRCVKGLVRNPASAKEVEVTFDPFAPMPVGSGDVLALRVLTRIGTNPNDTRCTGTGATHTGATGLRLYSDAASRNSRFDATISPDPSEDLFRHSDGGACPASGGQSPGVTTRFLDDTAPTAPSAKCKDSGSVNFAGGNPWKEIGTWSMTLP